MVPELVTGEEPIVNSEPEIPTLVTVPVLLGVTCEKVIESDDKVASESVVHKNILLSLVEPSCIITIWPDNSAMLSKSVDLDAVPEATTV